jgi:hypothetical protein
MPSWPDFPVRWHDHRTGTAIIYLVNIIDDNYIFPLRGNFLMMINTNKYLDTFHYGWYQWLTGLPIGPIPTGDIVRIIDKNNRLGGKEHGP